VVYLLVALIIIGLLVIAWAINAAYLKAINRGLQDEDEEDEE